jgi:hypothetical protein
MAKASKKKEPNPARRKAGQEAAAKDHPGPWGSVLWDHLEEIRKWRMARTKWTDVVVRLKEEHNITITAAAARNFFVRSRNPNLKLPDYLEHLRATPPSPPTPSQPAEDVNAKEENKGDVYDEALDAHLKQKQKPKTPPFKITKPIDL